ncbi:MAG: hypothetical protein ACC661_08180, partial [Verrucomicrobiales bacterium]
MAGRTATRGNNGLPQRVAPEHFAVLMRNSPFTRSLNLSDLLILTGLATMDGKQVATLMNKETKETYVVSEEPNPQGWRMVEVSGNEDLEKVAAKIVIGEGEVVTVRYDKWALKPGEAKPAAGGNSEIREAERRPQGRETPEVRLKIMGLPADMRRQVIEQIRKQLRQNPNLNPEERGKTMLKTIE